MKLTRQKKSRGFTLIELLIVIAILGALIMVGLGNYISSLQKGRDSKRKNDMRQVGIALEAYFADKGRYPAESTDGKFECHTPAVPCDWGTEFTDDTTIYMTQLPSDTTTNQRYYYVTDKNGTYFQLYARLENSMDNDVPHNGANAGTYGGTNCGSTENPLSCNYGVSSTNIPVTQDHDVVY